MSEELVSIRSICKQILQFFYLHTCIPVRNSTKHICDQLVLSNVEDWYKFFTRMKNWYQLLTYVKTWYHILTHVKTFLKRPLKNRQNFGFEEKLSLNAGQMCCRMLQGEHSTTLLTFIKLPFVIKIFVLSVFEWPFYTGFTVIPTTYKCRLSVPYPHKCEDSPANFHRCEEYVQIFAQILVPELHDCIELYCIEKYSLFIKKGQN